MSQIASFYLLKDGRRQELSNGDCSGAVYMAIWDWCESELDLDVRFPRSPDGGHPGLRSAGGRAGGLMCWQLCGSRTSRNWPLKLPQTWDLPTEAVQSGLENAALPSGTGAGRRCPAV